ncbi:MAG: hypothetical protein KF845_13180 [Cyclobacteriaceae bacterium]|nr:hypothetical protein [Cyclobacteriaceae bacterium]
MKQQPDHLFREKLENLQRKPSADAWSRIEAGLDKKNGKVLWLKIAAGLLLFFVASVLIWKIQFTEKTDTIVSATSEVKKSITEEIQSAQPEETIATSSKEDNPEKVEKKSEDIQVHKTHSTSTNQQIAEIEPAKEETLIEIVQPETETLIAQIENVSSEEISTETNTGVYIVLTAIEVNQKYLLPKSEHEATSEEKKSSRIQMLMDATLNISEGAFGDLRQKKDELFALSFLEDKKLKN